jgi:hypothetical protein
MPQVSRSYYTVKDIDVKISEISDGIYRIAGFVDTFGITFNQFLIDDEYPMLIHTGPIGMYEKIEEKVKEVIPLQKLAYVAFLHFESEYSKSLGTNSFIFVGLNLLGLFCQSMAVYPILLVIYLDLLLYLIQLKIMRFGLQHPNFSFDYDGQDTSKIVDSLKNLVTKAENCGFDSFWVMDHFHQIQFVGKPEEPMLEGWTVISYTISHINDLML